MDGFWWISRNIFFRLFEEATIQMVSVHWDLENTCSWLQRKDCSIGFCRLLSVFCFNCYINIITISQQMQNVPCRHVPHGYSVLPGPWSPAICLGSVGQPWARHHWLQQPSVPIPCPLDPASPAVISPDLRGTSIPKMTVWKGFSLAPLLSAEQEWLWTQACCSWWIHPTTTPCWAANHCTDQG